MGNSPSPFDVYFALLNYLGPTWETFSQIKRTTARDLTDVDSDALMEALLDEAR